jgi:anti-sigma factor RsiW
MQTPVDDTTLCAYADGELDLNSALAIEALAARDPAVRRRIEMFRESRDLVRSALSQAEYVHVPRRVRRSTEHAVFKRRPAAAIWSRRVLSAAALVLALGVGSGITRLLDYGTILPRNGVASVLGEIAEYHPIYAGEGEHLTEVPASRREHIEDWLGGRLSLALRAPDLTGYGLTFQGARLVALQGQPLAQLMYTGENQQRVALCVTKLVGRPSESSETLVEGGLKVIGLSSGEHVFLVIGPADEPMVDRLATELPSLLVAS